MEDRRAWHDALVEVNRLGGARLARHWNALPPPEPPTAGADHPYASDLDLFGHASLMQRVIEHMAPVLTRVFTPLFTLLLLAFLGRVAVTGNPVDVQREVLIAFDLLLVVVVGLVLYAVSARDPEAGVTVFDRLQLVLVVRVTPPGAGCETAAEC